MDYEKRYKEALERAEEAVQKGCLDRNILDVIFPELTESEDEKIRKWLIEECQKVIDIANPAYDTHKAKEAIAWLGQQECGVKGLKGPQEIGDWRGDEGVCKRQKEPLTPLAEALSNFLKNDFEFFARKEWNEAKWNEVMNTQAIELQRLAYLEKQQENPKSADSIPLDCTSDAKCEDRWHKVGDSLPDNPREVLCKDEAGNYFIGRYYVGEGWDISNYDDEDKPHHLNPPVSEWIDFPSEKQKESLHISETCKENADSFTDEQKPSVEICPHSIKSKSYKESGYPIEDCDYGLEIAENILEKTLGKVEGFQTDDGIREHQTAIKAVKDAMKEQKSVDGKEYSSPECRTTSGCTNDETEYDRGYREGHRFGLKQTQEYMLPEGRTFSGLIPCWVNAPSTLQPAHKYHGRNAVIMHENNGGFRCCFIDDEKATTVHLPENTFFVEGWRKNPAEWSEEDETMRINILNALTSQLVYSVGKGTCTGTSAYKYDDEIRWLKSLRPQHNWKPSEKEITAFENMLKREFPDGLLPSDYRELLAKLKKLYYNESIPSWKPSEEQMKALKYVNECVFLKDSRKMLGLKSLYEDLKKL